MRQREVGYEDEVFMITETCAPYDFTLIYFLIGFVIAVLLLATVMGFQTRHFPDNYRVILFSYFLNVDYKCGLL